MSRPSAYNINVDMNGFESQLATAGLRYLHSRSSPVCEGVKVAIGCLYSPLGAATDGQSLPVVRLMVGASEGSFEAYMALATSCTQQTRTELIEDRFVEPKQNIIKTTAVKNKPAGLGAKYLNSGVIELCAGVELAIICLYAPLGIRLGGGCDSEIVQAISESRQIFEKYMDLALRQFADDNNTSCFSNSIAKTRKAVNFQPERQVILTEISALKSVQSNKDLNGNSADDEIDLNEEL